MLDHLDDALESFLRATVPLSASDIDVSFEAPDREWAAKLTRPTVNMFLWDIRRSASRAKGGRRTLERNGQTVHQSAHPVVELRYVLTAWTSDHGDERSLLSGLVGCLLAHGDLPREFMPEELSSINNPHLLMARAGEDHMDVFKALEGQVKPGLNMVVVSEFDTGVAAEAGPPVQSIETAIGQINGSPPDPRRRVAGEIVDAENLGAIGAVVRSPTDATQVNAAGRFLLRAVEGDEIVLELDPERSQTVPAAGGVVFA